MSGTKTGGKKASSKNKELYGEDFYKVIGKKGGQRKVPKGFALMTIEKRIESGRKGGRNGKRKPSHPTG